jgi:hypothetical protein
MERTLNLEKQDRMAYNAAHDTQGVCLINQLSVDDYAMMDEKKAAKI